MKLKNGVEVLKVFNTLGARRNIYPTLIYDKDHVVLVDTGYPGHFQVIKEQIANALVPFEKLTKIIITHQDFDHMGGLSSFKEQDKDNQIEVLAHEADQEYIEGTKTPIKLTEEFMRNLKKMISEYSVTKQEALNHILDNYYVKVDKTLKDDEEIPICGGIKVIHVPGHTPGNICLYLKKHKILIAGDALNVIEGELYGPDSHATPELELAIKSLSKLNQYSIKTVICYHGGVYSNNVNKRIEVIIKDELNELLTKTKI